MASMMISEDFHFLAVRLSNFFFELARNQISFIAMIGRQHLLYELPNCFYQTFALSNLQFNIFVLVCQAPLYWEIYAPKGLNSARICFTCHNFEYQGTAAASELESCGLDSHHLNKPDRMQDNSAHDRVNSVKVY